MNQRQVRNGVHLAALLAPVLLLVLCPVQASAQGLRRGLAQAASAPATCRAGQLALGGLGSSTATGTVIFTLRITDISAEPCALDGYPQVTFLGNSAAALHVSVSHAGPAAAFARPRPIVLDPSSSPTAAFVITSRDDMAPQQRCGRVTAVRAVLPAKAGTFLSPAIPPPYQLCTPGPAPATAPFPVDISAIVNNSVAAGYAPAWPECEAEELEMTVGEEFAASGTAAYVVTLATRIQAGPTCTLDGYPGLALMTRSGTVVARFHAAPSVGTLPPLPRPRPVTVAGPDRAQFVFEAGDYQPNADDGQGAACPTSTELVVTLPGEGQLVAHKSFQLCRRGGVGAFTAAPA